MPYTMILRDENGEEVKIADLAISNIIYSTVLVCPKDSRLNSLQATVLKQAFDAAGIQAIVCNDPVLVYQVKPMGEG